MKCRVLCCNAMDGLERLGGFREKGTEMRWWTVVICGCGVFLEGFVRVREVFRFWRVVCEWV